MAEDKAKAPRVEKERRDFKRLLASNPNYFGNISEGPAATLEAAAAASGNTNYEQLHCVGLYPEQNLLEAVLEIKRPTGYSGDLCDDGSTEYVAFYIDWNDGAGFVGVGAPASVNVHDLTAGADTDLWYAVRKPFVPKRLLDCDQPQIVQVRAILSWETPPTGPGYVPVWGNVVDVWVQIQPKKGKFALIPGFELATSFDLELAAAPDPADLTEKGEAVALVGDKQEIKALIERSLEAQKAKHEEVEPQRHDFKAQIAKNPNYFGAISKSEDEGEILEAVLALEPEYSELLQAKLAIDPSLLVPVEIFDPKTSYEQLRCVGLYPENDLLEAVLEIKRPFGYKGDLCTLGSLEYVAFFIDWGDGGGYQWEGTHAVRVHDIPEVNGKHLHYAVRQKITNPKLQTCEIENIVRVKAILSWETPPTGPFYVPTWGNALECDVQIRPSTGASAHCDIEVVNEVHADDIRQLGVDAGYGIKVSGSSTVPGVWDRPFGGVVAVWGHVDVPGAHYYRFLYTTDDPADPMASWTPVLDSRRYRKVFPFGASGDRAPDANGWLSVSQFNTDEANYPLQALVHWRTGSKTGLHHLRLELGNLFKVPLPDPCDVSLLLDNQSPELFEFGGPNPPPIPTVGVAVKDSSGDWKRCEEFEGQETVHVWGNFRDDHFRSYSLRVFGGNMPVSGHVFANGSYDPGVPGVLGVTGIVRSFRGRPG